MPDSEKGRVFARLWNKSYRDGALKEIADHFGISPCTAHRIRKKLNLADLHDHKNHPGRRALLKRIKNLYVKKQRSSIQIAKMTGFSAEMIRKMLFSIGIEIRPQHVTNPLHLPTTNKDFTHHQLLKAIKDEYQKGLSAQKIAAKFRIDPGTVRTKLKAMNIQLRQNHNKVLKGGYPCQWCAAVMDKVYHNRGPRKQLYCCSNCKNKAKDYRRMLRGKRPSQTRLSAMNQALKEAWGKDFDKAAERILDVTPIITNGKKPRTERNITNYIPRGIHIPRSIQANSLKVR